MSGSGLLPCKLTSNQQLEQRFADQVGEIERIGRLRRFLPPRSPDLIVASGTEKQKTIAGRLRRSSAICAGFAGFSESSDPETLALRERRWTAHRHLGEFAQRLTACRLRLVKVTHNWLLGQRTQ
jgi:hypothetical protein